MTEIRTRARPRLRALRRTVLSALGMAAIIIGLLAMHSSGAEHATLTELSAVTVHTEHTTHADHAVAADHAAAPTAVAVAPALTVTGAVAVAVAVAAASMPLCDEACMHGIHDCAVLFMTCAMLLAVAAFIVVANRPAGYRKLFDARAQVVAMPPVAPLHVHRPDLTVLSIDRT